MSLIASIIEEIRRDVAGSIFLHDWLGKGAEVVQQDHAEKRGMGCLVCKKHRPQKWWERYVHDVIAHTIQRELELKNKMRLRVSMEDDLGMCSGCGCCARLKVCATIEHIKSHTDATTLNKLADDCWIKNELANV